MIEINNYCRKPFNIEAVQVTAENMDEVAEWSGGEVITDGTSKYIRVNVNRPVNDRLTRAFIGDWVSKASYGFKVYTNRAFIREFEPLTGTALDAANQAQKPQPVIAVG